MRRDYPFVVSNDMTSNALLGFIILFTLAFILITVKKKNDATIQTEGIFAIVMDWDDKSKDDVDLYLMDPDQRVSYFSSRDTGLMHLEYDDRGTLTDTVQGPNGEIVVQKNQERIIIRGIVPGEYVVNVHMFSKRDPGPTKTTVRLIRLKGDETVVTKERVLNTNGDEATGFRFTLDRDHKVSAINELPRKLTGQGRGSNQSGGSSSDDGETE